MTTLCLKIDQNVIDHQKELAHKAINGDEAALNTLARNFGFFAGSGTNYWPDTDKALKYAQRIVSDPDWTL